MALALLGLSKIKPPKQHKPHIAKDTVSSNSIFGGMYGLSEGEIAGLVDGGKSIFLDGTPLINANGQPNFSGVEWEFRSGTNDQSHIAGFPAVENEHSVGVELRHDKPWTTQINNTQLSAIAVRLNWHALRHQHANGDVTGYRIDYAVDVQTDSGSFVEVLKTHIQEKTSQGYKRSHRIELPKAKRSWTLRVRRLTANQDNEMIGDRMSIDAVTHIIDAKLRYPNTAVLGIKYDAQIFGNVAKLSVLLKGKLIAVPTNYDPDTRTYTGLWDGAFKQACSNNPAWIFYDVCTNKRYGLGERLTGMIDKWSLYRIAQYCDEMVDDGKGGQEPRFTCNVYLQKQEDAYTVLKNLASIFRAMMYYDGEQIVLDIDGPKDPVYTFSAANVIDGSFQYAGTRARDRHTAARVAWDNPDNDYKTEYTNVKDEEGIARFGLRFLDINAFGCTSLGQAQRAGMWALKSEQLETRTVVFRTGLQGYIPKIGEVINIADNLFAGRAISGRIASVSQDKRSITLDRDVIAKAGDTLVVNGSDSIEKRTITSAKKSVITVDNAFVTIAADDVWAIDSDSLRVMPFRILSAEQDGTIFTITALQHAPQKYVAIDDGAYIAQNPISVLNPNPIAGPDSVVIGSYNRVIQGQNVTTLTISWSQVERAAYYLVEWKKDDGNWMLLPKTASQSIDIDGVYAGQYIARVRAVDAFDNESLATSSQLTQITGKIGRPPRLARLIVQGKLFGMDLAWTFNKGSDDTNFTEIQVSPDGRANIATLGTFAYPTNKHEITGLQGNLTQYYRARIVDKLGNTSEWTAWVSGTTDAQADKVLDLISGQISQSHLDQSLRTPINKIGTLESGLNSIKGQIPTLQSAISTINGQLPTLNTEIANAKRDLQTAQNTLNTAVTNITTERNRISSAIRDITALQSANNAKTQEIANLVQTVGSHTSSIRELGVTTGDLAQKYNQIKTQADKSTSDITQIKQTQNGQATSIERLGARFDNLSVGGRNLIPNTQKHGNVINGIFDSFNVIKLIKPAERYIDYQYRLTRAMNEINCVFSFWAKADVDNVIVTAHLYSPNTITKAETSQGRIFKRADGMADITLSSEWQKYYVVYTQKPSDTPKAIVLRYQSSRLGTEILIAKPKLETGTIPTDWTQAPEDVQADIDTAKTETLANINTVRETLTNADIALGRKIDATSAEFKQADNAIKASVQAETTARTNADAAIAQTVNALQSDYSSNKASVASQIKTLSDKDKSTATQISQLTANVANAQNKADTADVKATQVKADIIAEQQARADAESSLARQMSALDSKFTNADNAIKASVAQAQQTATNAQQALATAQNQLNAKIDGISVGGRNLLLDSNKVKTGNYGERYKMSAPPKNGDDVIVTLWGELDEHHDDWHIYNTRGVKGFGGMTKIADGVWQKKFKWREVNGNTHLAVFQVPEGNGNRSRIDRIQLEIGTIATGYTPAPEDVQSELNTKASTASLDEYKQAQATKDKAQATKLSQLESSLGQKANATALNELNVRVQNVDGKITAEIKKVATMQTTLNGQTASIRNVEQSVNGVKAIKAVTVDNNGFISGYGLMSELQNGRVISRFGINADQIYFGSTTSSKKPFVFATRPITIDGISYPAGAWFNSASIAAATITNTHIANAAITSAKIATAQIGTAHIVNGAIDTAKIRDGVITTAKIGIAQIDTLQIKGEAITVPRAQSFDNHRSGLSGQIFSLSMNAMGGSVLVSTSFLVDCTNTVSTRSSGHAKAIATINKKLKLVIKCNGSVISERMFTFRDEREKEVSDNSNSGNRPVTATATAFVYDKMVSIINHVHRNPPANAVYTVELHDSGGEGSYVVTNGSVLLLGIKR